ncbi:hypothetical protein AWN90_38130 [Nocardia terpenica]|uniref:PUA domain-containing protein n=1 Tax=Nocardia terpenica TaxID=455432 RepID=A0A164L5J6_9NOCA|nr:hypothetical protein AWN90_38130 [Nocardia terpenica]
MGGLEQAGDGAHGSGVAGRHDRDLHGLGRRRQGAEASADFAQHRGQFVHRLGETACARRRGVGGDVVDLIAHDGRIVARGVVEYDSTELESMLGRSTSELPEGMHRPVVHADDLVKV